MSASGRVPAIASCDRIFCIASLKVLSLAAMLQPHNLDDEVIRQVEILEDEISDGIQRQQKR